ncbi:hypothetical protein MYOV011v1_p0190 [Vibrio phage 6E35.1a]|nr:hypothetical protein MYOV011v1_p0190 [Vibrio phage 6E35.1a]
MPISQGSINLGELVTRSEMMSELANTKFRSLEFEVDGVTELTVEHHRGYIPEYQLRNEDGRLVEVPVEHIDKNTLTICSVLPVTGTLYIY